MSNRSHFNGGHIGMNLLRKKGIAHSSVANLKPSASDCSIHLAVVADCLELLKRVPDDSIQLVVCDPPYNIKVAAWDDVANYLDWAGQWIAEVERVLMPTGNFVIFGGLQYQGESGCRRLAKPYLLDASAQPYATDELNSLELS